ncbi:unnamed protein product [Amoebophrya sp. A120]|nr:unnamed protein product [Amoebophrya sp. A120]|eukprot:GSA120T00018895001.1
MSSGGAGNKASGGKAQATTVVPDADGQNAEPGAASSVGGPKQRTLGGRVRRCVKDGCLQIPGVKYLLRELAEWYEVEWRFRRRSYHLHFYFQWVSYLYFVLAFFFVIALVFFDLAQEVDLECPINQAYADVTENELTVPHLCIMGRYLYREKTGKAISCDGDQLALHACPGSSKLQLRVCLTALTILAFLKLVLCRALRSALKHFGNMPSELIQVAHLRRQSYSGMVVDACYGITVKQGANLFRFLGFVELLFLVTYLRMLYGGFAFGLFAEMANVAEDSRLTDQSQAMQASDAFYLKLPPTDATFVRGDSTHLTEGNLLFGSTQYCRGDLAQTQLCRNGSPFCALYRIANCKYFFAHSVSALLARTAATGSVPAIDADSIRNPEECYDTEVFAPFSGNLDVRWFASDTCVRNYVLLLDFRDKANVNDFRLLDVEGSDMSNRDLLYRADGATVGTSGRATNTTDTATTTAVVEYAGLWDPVYLWKDMDYPQAGYENLDMKFWPVYEWYCSPTAKYCPWASNMVSLVCNCGEEMSTFLRADVWLGFNSYCSSINTQPRVLREKNHVVASKMEGILKPQRSLQEDALVLGSNLPYSLPISNAEEANISLDVEGEENHGRRRAQPAPSSDKPKLEAWQQCWWGYVGVYYHPFFFSASACGHSSVFYDWSAALGISAFAVLMLASTVNVVLFSKSKVMRFLLRSLGWKISWDGTEKDAPGIEPWAYSEYDVAQQSGGGLCSKFCFKPLLRFLGP